MNPELNTMTNHARFAPHSESSVTEIIPMMISIGDGLASNIERAFR